jgi:hypothetical protein
MRPASAQGFAGGGEQASSASVSARPPPAPVQPASWLASASAPANRAAPAGISKVRASQESSARVAEPDHLRAARHARRVDIAASKIGAPRSVAADRDR